MKKKNNLNLLLTYHIFWFSLKTNKRLSACRLISYTEMYVYTYKHTHIKRKQSVRRMEEAGGLNKENLSDNAEEFIVHVTYPRLRSSIQIINMNSFGSLSIIHNCLL